MDIRSIKSLRDIKTKPHDKTKIVFAFTFVCISLASCNSISIWDQRSMVPNGIELGRVISSRYSTYTIFSLQPTTVRKIETEGLAYLRTQSYARANATSKSKDYPQWYETPMINEKFDFLEPARSHVNPNNTYWSNMTLELYRISKNDIKGAPYISRIITAAQKHGSYFSITSDNMCAIIIDTPDDMAMVICGDH